MIDYIASALLSIALFLAGWLATRFFGTKDQLSKTTDDRIVKLETESEGCQRQRHDLELRIVRLEGQAAQTERTHTELKDELGDIRDNMVRRDDLRDLKEDLAKRIEELRN